MSTEQAGRFVRSIETEDTGGGVKLDVIELADSHRPDEGGRVIVVGWDDVAIYANRKQYEQEPEAPLQTFPRTSRSPSRA